jgi:hypothetical protein
MVGGRILAKKKKKCRSSGCWLQFGSAGKAPSRSQSSCKYQTHFSAPPYEQLKALRVIWSKDAMRVILF